MAANTKPCPPASPPPLPLCGSRLLQKFDTCRTAFLCCDIQEKLRSRIRDFHHAVHVSNMYARFHELLPRGRSVFLVTEQYPQGVGPTAHDIKLPADAHVFPKMEPSMLASGALPYIVGDPEKGLEPVQQVVLWGHETHVCIIHTADALLQLGIRVAISVDGCASQLPIQHDTAMMAMTAWPGLVPSTLISVYLQIGKNDVLVRRGVIDLCKRAMQTSDREPTQVATAPEEAKRSDEANATHPS